MCVLSSVRYHILQDFLTLLWHLIQNLQNCLPTPRQKPGGEGAQTNKELLQSPFHFTSETKRFALPSMSLIFLRGWERCGEGELGN